MLRRGPSDRTFAALQKIRTRLNSQIAGQTGLVRLRLLPSQHLVALAARSSPFLKLRRQSGHLKLDRGRSLVAPPTNHFGANWRITVGLVSCAREGAEEVKHKRPSVGHSRRDKDETILAKQRETDKCPIHPPSFFLTGFRSGRRTQPKHLRTAGL